MATPVVVVTPTDTPATEPVADEVEVDQAWLESSFANLAGVLRDLGQSMGALMEAQVQTGAVLQSLSARLPENLTQTISDQQATITRLVGESMETVRTLLTPPAPPVIVAEPEPNVAVENPVARTESPEPTRPKRVRL